MHLDSGLVAGAFWIRAVLGPDTDELAVLSLLTYCYVSRWYGADSLDLSRLLHFTKMSSALCEPAIETASLPNDPALVFQAIPICIVEARGAASPAAQGSNCIA